MASSRVDDEHAEAATRQRQMSTGSSDRRDAARASSADGQHEDRAGTTQKNGSSQVALRPRDHRRPRNSIVPAVGSMMPATTLKNVVLPAPLGPMRLTIEPSRDSRSTLADGDQAAEPLRSTRPRHASEDGLSAAAGRDLAATSTRLAVIGRSLRAAAGLRVGVAVARRRLGVTRGSVCSSAVAGDSGTGLRAAAASSPPGPGRRAGTGTG